MNIRSLKSFAAVGLIAVGALASSLAHASIVVGSRVHIIGGVFVDPANPYRMVFQTIVGAQHPDVNTVQIGSGGNLLSYAGYNFPNPLGENYSTTIRSLPAVPPALVGPIANFLSLPAVSVVSGEPGPAVPASTFDLMSWTTTLSPDGRTLSGQGLGVINWAGGSIDGEFQLSIPFFGTPAPPGNIYAFSATLAAIPVPGAVLLFGSGLLFMTLVGRFRRG